MLELVQLEQIVLVPLGLLELLPLELICLVEMQLMVVVMVAERKMGKVPLTPEKIRFCWDNVSHQQGSKRPLPKKLRKSPKRGSGVSRPWVQKKLEKDRVENDYFSSFFRAFGFSTLSTFFELIDPGAGRPRQPLFRLFFGVF